MKREREAGEEGNERIYSTDCTYVDYIILSLFFFLLLQLATQVVKHRGKGREKGVQVIAGRYKYKPRPR